MGAQVSTPIVKQGKLYSQVKASLRPLDMLLFSGGEFVSKFIKHVEITQLAQKKGIPVEPGAFSHVGLVVTSEILDHELVLPEKIYIWESTMGGALGDGVTNVEGKTFFGVQLRDFDTLVPVYDTPDDTSIAVAHLLVNPLDSAKDKEEIKKKFTEIFHKYNGVLYDINLLDEMGSIFGVCRRIRDQIDEVIGDDKWLFCSEHVATVYQDMGIFPPTVIPENVVPMDLVGYDNDTEAQGGIPLVVSLPPTYIVSSIHYQYDGPDPTF
jgi:hypothetical protein